MKVKELLSSPEKWTKGYWARDENGLAQSHVYGAQCVCWCLLGAVTRCYKMDEAEIVRHLIQQRLGLSPGEVLDWNDHPDRTFEDVRQLITELDI